MKSESHLEEDPSGCLEPVKEVTSDPSHCVAE